MSARQVKAFKLVQFANGAWNGACEVSASKIKILERHQVANTIRKRPSHLSLAKETQTCHARQAAELRWETTSVLIYER